MVGWLQKTVQGMPNLETAGSGSWNQPVRPGTKEVSLTWSKLINRS